MAAGAPGSRRSVLSRALLRTPELLVRGALLTACAAFLALGILPRTGWYRPVTVLSGSMRPTFAPGDMVIVTPEPLRDVRVGQVINYAIPVGDHHIETHRVVALVRGGAHPVVRTKGDANDTADPWTARLNGTTAWRVRGVVPKLGWAVFLLRSPLAHNLTVLLAPLLLAIVGVAKIWRRPRHALPHAVDDGSIG